MACRAPKVEAKVKWCCLSGQGSCGGIRGASVNAAGADLYTGAKNRPCTLSGQKVKWNSFKGKAHPVTAAAAPPRAAPVALRPAYFSRLKVNTAHVPEAAGEKLLNFHQ